MIRTTLRGSILLLVALWLGGILFFPVVAWAAFLRLGDPRLAGNLVRQCLHTLHVEGLIAGLLLLPLLLLANAARAYTRSIAAPALVTLAMLALTAFSQYSIMPRMDADRLGSAGAGGSIDMLPGSDKRRIDFDRLHALSVHVEEGVLVGGILLVFLLARSPLPARRT